MIYFAVHEVVKKPKLYYNCVTEDKRRGNMARGGFPNMGGMNMQQMMKQAQKMQQDMMQAQEELGTKEFTAQAGGGVVKATVYGRKELKNIEIDPACVDIDDMEMLQDLITAAVNEALRIAGDAMQSEMGKLTGGLNLGL